MYRLDDKVAVVTGGTSGIGAETARWLCRAGARVAVAGRRADRGQKIVDALGPAATYVRTDVTVEQDVGALMHTVVERFGRVDILATSAGVINRIPAPDLALKEWHRILDVNLTGVFLASTPCPSCSASVPGPSSTWRRFWVSGAGRGTPPRTMRRRRG